MQYELIWSRPTTKDTVYGEDVIEFVYGIFSKMKMQMTYNALQNTGLMM